MVVDFYKYFAPMQTHVAHGVKWNWIGICYNQKLDNNKKQLANIKMDEDAIDLIWGIVT